MWLGPGRTFLLKYVLGERVFKARVTLISLLVSPPSGVCESSLPGPRAGVCHQEGLYGTRW